MGITPCLIGFALLLSNTGRRQQIRRTLGKIHIGVSMHLWVAEVLIAYPLHEHEFDLFGRVRWE